MYFHNFMNRMRQMSLCLHLFFSMGFTHEFDEPNRVYADKIEHKDE